MQLPSDDNPQEGDAGMDVDEGAGAQQSQTNTTTQRQGRDDDEKGNSPPVAAPKPAALPLQRKGTVSRYKLGRQVKSTLFGGVYYGQDQHTGKWVIIKRSLIANVERGINREGEYVPENLREEIRVQSLLNEQHVQCKYLGVLLDKCEDQRFVYQILQYYPNGDLYEYVLRWRHDAIPRTPLAKASSGAGPAYPICKTENISRKYYKQLLNAVYYMHLRRISHRDLSLENVMVDDDNNLRVIDFGLAIEYSEEDPEMWRCRPPPLGKMQYMSPECCVCKTSDKTYDARANDIWCLGVMLFMMLFGVPPFQTPSHSDARFTYCLRDAIPTLVKLWKKEHLASPMAIDLLHKIFKPEEKRITMEQIMCHPWIRGPSTSTDAAPSII